MPSNGAHVHIGKLDTPEAWRVSGSVDQDDEITARIPDLARLLAETIPPEGAGSLSLPKTPRVLEVTPPPPSSGVVLSSRRAPEIPFELLELHRQSLTPATPIALPVTRPRRARVGNARATACRVVASGALAAVALFLMLVLAHTTQLVKAARMPELRSALTFGAGRLASPRYLVGSSAAAKPAARPIPPPPRPRAAPRPAPPPTAGARIGIIRSMPF